MRELLNIPIAKIHVGDRLRELDSAHADLIGDSLDREGQFQAIEVAPYRTGKFEWKLVFGLHRLEGARRKGKTHIEAKRAEGDVDRLQLREIEENLFRRDLTALDRAFAVERWFHLNGVVRQPGADEESVANQSFAKIAKRLTAKVAERAGLSERSIYNDLKLARLLAAVRKDISALPVAGNGAELMMLARMNSEKRAATIKALRTGKTFKEATASKKTKPSEKDRHLSALIALWRKTPVAAKRAFVKAFDRELADLIERAR